MPARDRSATDGGDVAEAGDGDRSTPSVWENVALSDGTSVLVRSVEPGDAEELAAGYQSLSESSAYQRFFTVLPQLSPQQLRFFTQVDHRDHEALGAVAPETGQGVGIARFIRSDTDPASAELAIAVADDWQRRGVGFQLLRLLLTRARQEDVTTISAEVLTENSALLRLLRHFGSVHTEVSGTTTTATLRLPSNPDIER
ncbi:GNAT family N-acetyltransferase [Actinomycetospora lemnae]|uniref:GNAT family N-acetyltransferase n=1 Tax=Actinomycetospora lemnae TaxID=3019891 RepID=A0ABT5T0R9_9PSEU|nr:GNAT family N-acetyltransferase [Actinomycetospora sp. DW7H6]MDD7967817.1 GNAT family N-acetyltransferase [Actinomycetospora sp. DW7H6]